MTKNVKACLRVLEKNVRSKTKGSEKNQRKSTSVRRTVKKRSPIASQRGKKRNAKKISPSHIDTIDEETIHNSMRRPEKRNRKNSSHPGSYLSLYRTLQQRLKM